MLEYLFCLKQWRSKENTDRTGRPLKEEGHTWKAVIFDREGKFAMYLNTSTQHQHKLLDRKWGGIFCLRTGQPVSVLRHRFLRIWPYKIGADLCLN